MVCRVLSNCTLLFAIGDSYDGVLNVMGAAPAPDGETRLDFPARSGGPSQPIDQYQMLC